VSLAPPAPTDRCLRWHPPPNVRCCAPMREVPLKDWCVGKTNGEKWYIVLWVWSNLIPRQLGWNRVLDQLLCYCESSFQLVCEHDWFVSKQWVSSTLHFMTDLHKYGMLLVNSSNTTVSILQYWPWTDNDTLAFYSYSTDVYCTCFHQYLCSSLPQLVFFALKFFLYSKHSSTVINILM